MESQGTSNTQNNHEKKNKVGVLDSKTYYKAIVIKIL